MSSAFTPLEALLLFQYLSNYGVSPSVFARISDLLKSDEQVRRSNSYDATRLSPDSLRDFYLRLLKEETRSELTAAESNEGINGDVPSSTSRKRKAPSPTLPTVQEASKAAHLLPHLIRKLYARYREHAIIEIKEEERRYEKQRRGVEEIKSGARDQVLQREVNNGDWNHVVKRSPAQADVKSDGLAIGFANGVNMQPSPKPRDGQRTPVPEARQAAPTPQSLPSGNTLHAGRPPYQQANGPPSLPSSRHAPLYPAPPSQTPQQTMYSQSAQHHAPPAISPRPPDSRPSSRTSQPPAMLPPPPPHSSQPFPPYPYANSPQLPHQLPPHSPYAPPPAPNSYTGPNTPYQQHPAQQVSHVPYQAQHGVMLQPFAVAPQTPQAQVRLPAPSKSTGTSTRGPPLQPLAAVSSGSRSPYDIAKLLASPLNTRRLQSPLVAPSPSKDTRWRNLPPKAPRVEKKASPPPPRSRSVSPISEKAPSPPPEPEPETMRRPRRVQASKVPSDVASRTARTRRTRGASATSSVPGSSVRGRTRSQSVMSHGEDVSMVDAESVTGRRVKHEPSTPMESSDFIRPTIEGTPGQTSRRSALPSGTNKRKRAGREESEASDSVLMPRQDKSVVLANKNFNRLSATIMNDIQSHKHASLFGLPVRDRDAEGYSDIIRRPQDLKSIRAAITAGNRAVNAATAADSFASSSNSQRDAGGIVVLPVTEELIPPKAIVNSGQLEKEVMRMFANAVLFNPGDEDVVHDAREMAEGVEAQIAKFREVERGSNVMPVLSEPGTQRTSEGEADEDETGNGKRRKVG